MRLLSILAADGIISTVNLYRDGSHSSPLLYNFSHGRQSTFVMRTEVTFLE